MAKPVAQRWKVKKLSWVCMVAFLSTFFDSKIMGDSSYLGNERAVRFVSVLYSKVCFLFKRTFHLFTELRSVECHLVLF